MRPQIQPVAWRSTATSQPATTQPLLKVQVDANQPRKVNQTISTTPILVSAAEEEDEADVDLDAVQDQGLYISSHRYLALVLDDHGGHWRHFVVTGFIISLAYFYKTTIQLTFDYYYPKQTGHTLLWYWFFVIMLTIAFVLGIVSFYVRRSASAQETELDAIEQLVRADRHGDDELAGHCMSSNSGELSRVCLDILARLDQMQKDPGAQDSAKLLGEAVRLVVAAQHPSPKLHKPLLVTPSRPARSTTNDSLTNSTATGAMKPTSRERLVTTNQKQNDASTTSGGAAGMPTSGTGAVANDNLHLIKDKMPAGGHRPSVHRIVDGARSIASTPTPSAVNVSTWLGSAATTPPPRSLARSWQTPSITSATSSLARVSSVNSRRTQGTRHGPSTGSVSHRGVDPAGRPGGRYL